MSADGQTTVYVYQLLCNDTTWVDLFNPSEDYAEALHVGINTGLKVRLVRRTITNEVLPS